VEHEPEQPSVDVAAEYLREQGLEVPEIAVQEPMEPVVEQPTVEVAKINMLPDGFEPLTAAGERRCFARTGSGSQCSNAAVADSNACGLGAHREQVG